MRAFGIGKDEDIKKLFDDVDTDPEIKYIIATIVQDAASNVEEGLTEMYKRIRPGDRATADNARQMIHNMFFNFSRYDLSRVGRYRMNQRFGANLSLDDEKNRVLLVDDIVNTMREIIRLNNDPQSRADNIDHLGHRRVKTLGELLQDKLRLAFTDRSSLTWLNPAGSASCLTDSMICWVEASPIPACSNSTRRQAASSEKLAVNFR